MKKFILSLCVAVLFVNVFAQEMHVKEFNFTSFHQESKRTTVLLEQKSSPAAKAHPEYGVLPYNSQCRECVELIDERSEFTRQYIDTGKGTHFGTQQSYFPLHYKQTANDIWRTIDFRLKQSATDANVYEAKNQPFPTGYDVNKRSNWLNVEDLHFEYNQNLKLFFFDNDVAYTQKQQADYSHYSIGEEGVYTTNVWPGINMEQIFRTGEIETNFIINQPLTLPITTGWMVIEDRFTLPDGYEFAEDGSGAYSKDSFFSGGYVIKNTKTGLGYIPVKKPIYIDAKAWGMHGTYRLSKDSNTYTLQILVPVNWLTKKENTYPLFIDPIVGPGQEKIGDFRSSGNGGLNMGFSTKPASCDDHFSNQTNPPRTPVTVPGKSQLTQVFVDVEYELTYDNTCGNPPLPNPYCTFAQASMEVVSDQCQISTGQLSCNPASPPFTGTCTTDNVLVPGAHSLEFDNLVSCYQPQCADYAIDFTLKNQDSLCGDVCGYLCARGNMWEMSVFACTVEGNISQDKTVVCGGDSVTFTAHADCGVPPYHYIWSHGNKTDTIYNSPNFILQANSSTNISCTILDSCNNYFLANQLSVNTHAPTVSISGDTLTSSALTGNQWYRNDSLIVGATGQTYIITQLGVYTVQFDSANCLSGFSTPVDLTGVNNLDKTYLVNIYPNPATSELTMQVKGFQPQLISIVDVNGRKVREQKFATKIDISSLATGTYFIEIKGKDTVVRRRFEKE